MFIYRFLYPIHVLLFTVRSILLHRKGELYYGCCCLVLLRWKFCLLLDEGLRYERHTICYCGLWKDRSDNNSIRCCSSHSAKRSRCYDASRITSDLYSWLIFICSMIVARLCSNLLYNKFIPFNPKPATLSACPRHTFFPCITTSLDMSFGMMY